MEERKEKGSRKRRSNGTESAPQWEDGCLSVGPKSPPFLHCIYRSIRPTSVSMKDAEARSPREAAAAAARRRRRRRPVMGCIAKISASFRKIWLSTLNLFHRHSQGKSISSSFLIFRYSFHLPPSWNSSLIVSCCYLLLLSLPLSNPVFFFFLYHLINRLIQNSFVVSSFLSFPGTGFDKIYRDVQACGYGDVHVMWSILQQHSHQQIISHKLSSSQSFPSSSSSSSSSSSLSSSALHEALCPSSSLWYTYLSCRREKERKKEEIAKLPKYP